MDTIKELLGNQILKQKVKEAQKALQDLELYTTLIYKLDRKLINDPIYTDDDLGDLITMIDLVKCHYHGKYTTIDFPKNDLVLNLDKNCFKMKVIF